MDTTRHFERGFVNGNRAAHELRSWDPICGRSRLRCAPPDVRPPTSVRTCRATVGVDRIRHVAETSIRPSPCPRGRLVEPETRIVYLEELQAGAGRRQNSSRTMTTPRKPHSDFKPRKQLLHLMIPPVRQQGDLPARTRLERLGCVRQVALRESGERRSSLTTLTFAVRINYDKAARARSRCPTTASVCRDRSGGPHRNHRQKSGTRRVLLSA